MLQSFFFSGGQGRLPWGFGGRRGAVRPAVRILLAIVLVLAAPAFAAAQAELRPRFQHVGVDDGLSISSVLCAVQDAQGFLWFGTYDGLNRHDGLEFVVHRADPENPKSLSDSNIRSLLADPDNTLWVGTKSGGLNRLGPDRSGFTAFRHDPNDPSSLPSDEVRAILRDASGALWVGTAQGLARFDESSGTFSRFTGMTLEGLGLAGVPVLSLAEDETGVLWIGSTIGLFKLDATRTDLRTFAGACLPQAPVLSLLAEAPGRIVAGYEEAGLALIDVEFGTCRRYLGTTSVQALMRSARGYLHAGTSSGLATMRPGRDHFQIVRNNRYDPQSLVHDDVHCLMQDAGGVIWVGTYAGGLSKLNPAYQAFGLLRNEPWNPNSLSGELVSAVFLGRDGVLWVGTSYDGLNMVNRQTGEVTVFRNNPRDPKSLSFDRVSCLHEDRKGRLWVGTVDRGLNLFERETQTFRRFGHDPDDPETLSQDKIWWIHEDREGFLWIGTSRGGLNRFDPETGRVVRYRHDPADPSSLPHDRVRHIMQTRDGTMWIGTNAGLSRFDPATGKFQTWGHDPGDPASLSNPRATPIVEDGLGRLWVGTDDGLNLFDPATGRFTQFTAENSGLADDAVQGMLLDGTGNLWLSTYRGLSHLNTVTFEIRNFSARDGLQGPEFWMNAAHKGFNGEMFFGGQKGLTYFFPENITPNAHLARPVLTGLTVMGRDRPLAEDISVAEHLDLTYDDRVVTFRFGALDFADPRRNQCAYMLEGFDEDFVLARQGRYATYTNLDPGRYVFRVRAANNNNVWSPEERRLVVVVAPPFWRTWWFMSLVTALLALSIYAAHRQRVAGLVRRRRELEETVQAQTASLRAEIEERALAEKRLRQSRDSFTKIFEHTPLGVTISDMATGTILQANPAIFELFRARPEEVLGRTSTELGVWPSASERENFVRDVAERGVVLNREVTLRVNERPLDCLLSAASIEAFGRKCILTIVTDITVRKRLEAELHEARKRAEDANRAKSEFLANMSHELRTPVAGIIGVTRILFEQAADGPTRDGLRLIRESSDMLLEIINDVLDLSKIEAGRLDMESIPFNPREAMRSALSLAQIMAGQKGLSFEVEMADDLPRAVRGDPVRLRQVLNNLLSNAVKFTEKGEVRVVVSATGQDDGAARIAFSVRDTGIGIPEEKLGAIFESFTQADGSTTRRYGGSGLGLAISRHLATLMGGDIAVQSRVGEGSVFTAELPFPLADAAELPPEEPGEAADGPAVSARPLSVLVVEDHAVNRILLKHLLARKGHKVVLAESGQAALSALVPGLFDVVVLDGQMPGMDGIETARRIRALPDPGLSRLPLVGLTAHALPEYRERFMQAGIDAFFVKPPDPEAFLATLQRLARREKAVQTEEGAALSRKLEATGSLGLGTIREYAGDDPETMVRLCDAFIKALPQYAEQLDAAAEKLDLSEIRGIIHKLRTSLVIFGASEALALAEALNETAKSGDTRAGADQAHELAKRLTALLDDVKILRDGARAD